jgi:hypothetical protein
MPARRTQGLSPGLFTTATVTKAPPSVQAVGPKIEVTPAAEPTSQRHLLPKDLPGALKRLDDRELDALLEATINELKRRDRPPSNLLKDKSSLRATSQPRQPLADDGAGSLTTGKLNAVRAAFKAGVKPSAIARQFGISQSEGRKALATEGRDRKSGR